MEDHIGKTCPVCLSEITDEDTIKVCPICGNPHHEKCWEENNGCFSGCVELPQEETVSDSHPVFCENCGTALDEGHDFCPKCGTPRDGKKKRVCGNCHAELLDEQVYCPKCGTRYVDMSHSPFPVTNYSYGSQSARNKKVLISIIALASIVIIGLILFFALRGTPVSEVSFNKESLTIVEGESFTLVCTVSPDNASDKTLEWQSSNKSVAKVNSKGVVTAVSEGTCTITAVSTNKKIAECRVTVEKAGPDFKDLYYTYCSPTYATVGYDGSYLSIDTNPNDIDDYTADGSIEAIIYVNMALGLPDYVLDDMGSTTALMGKQSESFPELGVTVSWSYHPNNGLEVTYKSTK